MNRVIKFRAWDKKKKEWYENFDVLPDGTVRTWYGEQDDMGGELWDVREDVELVQFTGLLDKNGKDVFEGDNLLVVDDVIVETIGGYPRREPEGRIESVEFKDGSFWWGDELLWEVARHGEVISNIYENPELLSV